MEEIEDAGVCCCLSEREETGLRASFPDADSSVTLGAGDTDAGVDVPLGWIILIGTLRLFGPEVT